MDKYKTMGEQMEEGMSEGWTQIAMWGGYLLYLGGVAYVAVHNFNLFTNTNILPDALKIWGYGTAAILAVNALVLPALIHARFMPGGQKEWAMLIYVLDIVVAIGNAVVDSIFNRGGQLQGIEEFYFQYVVVATPVLFGIIAWAVIWMLDPSQKMRDAKAKAKAAALKTLQTRMIERAKSDLAIDDDLTAAADELNRGITREVVGIEKKRAGVLDERMPREQLRERVARVADEEQDVEPSARATSPVEPEPSDLNERFNALLEALRMPNLVEMAKARQNGHVPSAEGDAPGKS